MHLEHAGHKCCGGWNEQNEQNERNEQYRKIQRKETPTISEELFHLFWENKRFVFEDARCQDELRPIRSGNCHFCDRILIVCVQFIHENNFDYELGHIAPYGYGHITKTPNNLCSGHIKQLLVVMCNDKLGVQYAHFSTIYYIVRYSGYTVRDIKLLAGNNTGATCHTDKTTHIAGV